MSRWTVLDRIREEIETPCRDPYGHIWSSKRGGYCVTCGLIIGKRTRGFSDRVVATPTPPSGKKVNRPNFNNRPELIVRLACRDGGMWCWYCTIGLCDLTTTIDHATPLCYGRQWHKESNFRLCCVWCNRVKGNMTEQEYRQSAALIERQRYVAGVLAKEYRIFQEQT